MADTVSLTPGTFLTAGATVAEVLQRAALAPSPPPPILGLSPADSAASVLSTAVGARIAAAAGDVAPRGPKLQTATSAAVQRLSASDTANAEKIRAVGASADESDQDRPPGDSAIQALDGKATPPPPPPLPPPLAPGPNDDPWAHGGDRRVSSVATSGVKQKLVAAAELEMQRNGQDNAASLLEHYLDNSGTPVALSPQVLDSWLTSDTNTYGDQFSAPARQINANIRAAAAGAAEAARSAGAPVTVTGNTPWATVAGGTGDSVRSLGHYSLSTAYSVTVAPDGSFSATYRNDVYDWYNFATRPYSGVAQGISSAAHDLQAVGVAQDFLVTGSGSVQQIQGTLGR